MNKVTIILTIIILAMVCVIAYVFFHAVSQKPEQSVSVNNTIQNNSNMLDIQGMKVEILKEGTGDGAKVSDNIVVNYVGTLTDGTQFDSSLNPGRKPFPYTLGKNQVIQGWELGLLGMKTGEERKLTIPPELGYGAAGANGVIPPNATLIFDITMLSINGK
jgi:FKBP-type peptidyl-prolyl cis-trans isomerase